ncbi:NAD(P)H-binding protein [Nonomuraea sp. NPDC050328]|uniref:NAD(P)H-binding protein n=1 Tax=Nonomuraea sp. NPDC050328 TaxID=3364361 RepID=UPI0037907C81
MILVTGAAGGQQGATGRRVTELLLDAGQQVRAFVRADDHRAEELRKLGAEVFVGDLREIQSVRQAVKGVTRAYFTYPVTAGLLDASAAFAMAAREAGLERVVEVSQLDAGPSAGTPHMRRHWLAEQVFTHALGDRAVHLRAGVFFENLAVQAALGKLAMPLGGPDTWIPLVAAEDVARVGAGLVLADPDPEPVCLVNGQMATVGQIAAAFGVPYEDLDPGEWERRAREVYRDEVAVEHLSHLWALFRFIGSGHHPLFVVTPSIRQYGGRDPLTLAGFVSAPGGR